jgi:hypothetical protein
MILRAIVNHFLIELLALRVLNLRYELDRSKVSIHTTYKKVRQMQRHIFGILVSKDDKIQSMIQSHGAL